MELPWKTAVGVLLTAAGQRVEPQGMRLPASCVAGKPVDFWTLLGKVLRRSDLGVATQRVYALPLTRIDPFLLR